ncbi:MAG: hypothetical protein QXT28_06420 [Thermofilaceae archaeon]
MKPPSRGGGGEARLEGKGCRYQQVLCRRGSLTADEVRAIYERDALIRNGLVLHLDFSEGEGDIAYDKSGHGQPQLRVELRVAAVGGCPDPGSG